MNGNTLLATTISFDNESIPVRIEYRDRKHLAINVYPDKQVTVFAPRNRAQHDVLSMIQRRAAWIVKQRAYFERFHPLTPGRRCVSGETHLFLGRQYRLKLHSHRRSEVKLIGKYLNVYTPTPDLPRRVRNLLDRWYKEHATDLFERQIRRCLPKIYPSPAMPSAVNVRKLAKRWGSCSRKGRIALNVELVKAPLSCIEYVVMHELCHLKEHNHGKAFYRLLSGAMPDWPQRKRRLDLFVI